MISESWVLAALLSTLLGAMEPRSAREPTLEPSAEKIDGAPLDS